MEDWGDFDSRCKSRDDLCSQTDFDEQWIEAERPKRTTEPHLEPLSFAGGLTPEAREWHRDAIGLVGTAEIGGASSSLAVA